MSEPAGPADAVTADRNRWILLHLAWLAIVAASLDFGIETDVTRCVRQLYSTVRG